MTDASKESREEECSGKLVALEGDFDTISTQLSLLPPSQKILVLPSLLESLPLESDEDAFDARTFIDDVQRTLARRNEAARSFLLSSTKSQPKLVFMNGGTVGARAICIDRICKSIMNGQIGEADQLFNDIVKDGIASLRVGPTTSNEVETDVDEAQDASAEGINEETSHVESKDSMLHTKSSNSLDRERAILQSAELVNKSLQRQISKGRVMEAVRNAENGFANTKRGSEGVYATSHQNGSISAHKERDDIVRTVLTIPDRKTTVQERRSTFGPRYGPNPSSYSVMSADEATYTQHDEDSDIDDDYEPDLASSEDNLTSVSATPGVVYGEACLVDVQSGSPTKSIRRAKSADRFYPSNARFLEPTTSPRPLKHTTSANHLRNRPQTSGGAISNVQESFQTLPRTTFIKASETTIKKSPTLISQGSSRCSSAEDVSTHKFVDRGCDSHEAPVESPKNIPFVAVFELVEDLVIHFTSDSPNEVFEFVLNSYKDGSYPVMPETPLTSAPQASDDDEETPMSPFSPRSPQADEILVRPTSFLTAETDDAGYERRHEYNPYAFDDDSYPPAMKWQWPPRETFSPTADSAISSSGPPTPTLTPPPQNQIKEKFLEFAPIISNNSINIQNSLRQLLSIQFPNSEGYSQHYYPVSRETDRLWKPVFRNDDTPNIGNESRTVDQVIALGCDEGVKKDFFFQISGQIEKLGTKRDGASRSGKLDIRYLISNVMQQFYGFSAVPRGVSNPLTNPKMLAALLVPQIEVYLASNFGIRLLILQYSATHLEIIFELRKLLGQDIFKVAGILNSLASDPPSMSRPRTPTMVNPLSNEAVSSRAKARNPLQRINIDSLSTLNRRTSYAGSIQSTIARNPKITFAKANYLLPNTATDAEITTFLSSIWKSLMEKSSFYTPEPEPKPIIIERPPIPQTPICPTSTRNKERDRSDRDTYRDSGYPPSYRGAPSKISRLTGNSGAGAVSTRSYAASTTSTARQPYAPSTTSTRHAYAASIASNKTTNTERREREDKEWENFYIGEDDSEDDAYDRMIMGRSGAKIVPEVKKVGQKRNTKKALKWLGLA